MLSAFINTYIRWQLPALAQHEHQPHHQCISSSLSRTSHARVVSPLAAVEVAAVPALEPVVVPLPLDVVVFDRTEPPPALVGVAALPPPLALDAAPASHVVTLALATVSPPLYSDQANTAPRTGVLGPPGLFDSGSVPFCGKFPALKNWFLTLGS
jgi:hypothetical protein